MSRTSIGGGWTCVEASTLGWQPGIWPRQVVQEGRTYHSVGVERDTEGDLVAVRYEDEEGRQLTVLND